MITQVYARPAAPKYRIPWRYAAGFLTSLAAGQSRSFARDARLAMTGLSPPARTIGLESVPADGPCLVVCNHYHRPGFDAWWLAFAISTAVASQRAPDADPEIHWVMTAAWTFPGSRWKQQLFSPITRRVFARAAGVYGFITMPPMPPTPEEMEARAIAILRTLRLARELAPAGGMIGLAPEGQDFSSKLGQPPSGAGTFISLLVEAGLPVLPAGLSETEGRLTVSFGRLFTPAIPTRRALRDKAVAGEVMRAIERLLPAS